MSISHIHGSNTHFNRDNTTNSNAKKDENKFSSSSSSFTSAASVKYKSIEKIVYKNRELATICKEGNNSPPPLPRSAAPLLNRQNAEEIENCDDSENEENGVNDNENKNLTADDARDVSNCIASSTECEISTGENLATPTASGGRASNTVTESTASTRRSRIDMATSASGGSDERFIVVGRHSRSGSNYNTNRVALNSIAPYIPSMPTRQLQPYTTYQRYETTQSRPAIYSINTSKAASVPYKMQMFFFLEVAIRRVLFHLAKAATQYQFLFRILPLLLTLLPPVAIYFTRANLIFDVPPFESFLPDVGVNDYAGHTFDVNLYHKYFAALAAVAPAATISAADFNGSNPMFDAPRRTSPYDFSVILSIKDPQGSILTNASLTAYRRLFERIRNISVTNSLVRLEWMDMCREECEDQPVISAIQNRQLLLKYPEAIVLKTLEENIASGGRSATVEKSAVTRNNSFHNVNRVFLANILGGVELDLDGIITRAQSLLLNIKLKESLKPNTLVAFEKSLRNVLFNFSAITDANFEKLELNAWSFRTYVSEVMHAAKDTHVRLIFCFAIFSVISFAVLGFCHRNAYKCRPFVAIQIVFVTTFAALVNYSIHLLGANSTFNYALYPSLFVLGALSTLLFATTAQCFSRYSLAALHPVEKLAFIYSWDMLAFVGTIIALSSASAGCAWIAKNALIRQLLFALSTGLVTLLLFGVLYLTVFWYVAEKREASGLKWFQICKMGDESFSNKYVFDYDELICDRLHEKLADLRPSVSRWMGQLAARNHFRTLCAVTYTAFLIFVGFGLFANDRQSVKLRENFFVSNTKTYDSSAAFLNRFDAAYEKYADYIEVVFELPVDYYNKRNKERIFDLLRWPLDTQYATRVVSWLMDFERFKKSTIFDVNPETIAPVVNYVFLKSDAYHKYSTDIVFDRFQTQILKSRMYLELSSKGVAYSDVLIRELEKRAREANLPVVFNAPYAFLLRHDRYAFHVALSAFIWLLTFLTLASVVFFTHVVIWLCVPLSTLLATIGACGLLQIISVPFNIVTMSTVLIGNLFTAAVTIYFCYAFNNAGHAQDTNAKRMKYAFQCALWPTILASVLPLLCYTPLLIGVIPPVVVQVFKALAAILLFTLFNFLFLLPSVTVIFADYISLCASSINNFCDSKPCCVVEQPAESIYFVPSRSSGEMHALSSIHATRSIAAFYNAPNYIMNETAILPPAYDYRQRMITAPPDNGGEASPPPLPPPSLPPLPITSNSAGRRSLCSQLNSANATTRGNSVLCVEQLSSSYPNAYRSPNQRRLPQSPSTTQNTHSPKSNTRQRFINTSSGNGSSHPSHRGMSATHESADNSNCESLDLRRAHPTNRRQTAGGDALSGLRRDLSANASPANSPRVSNVKRRTTKPHAGIRLATGENEQIYEDPESPVVMRPRRSHSDECRRNAIFDVAGTNGTASSGVKSSFFPHVFHREIADQMIGGASATAMQSNWRQYLLREADSTRISQPVASLKSQPASATTNRQRYRL